GIWHQPHGLFFHRPSPWRNDRGPKPRNQWHELYSPPPRRSEPTPDCRGEPGLPRKGSSERHDVGETDGVRLSPHPDEQGVVKKGSRRREEADFGVKNSSASLPRR